MESAHPLSRGRPSQLGAITAYPDPKMLAERKLVRAAQAGEIGAFEALYRATVGLIHALCLRMSQETSVAEELTQEVFVRAWEKLATFRGESAFATWLTRLAVNVVLSARRSRRRDEAHLAFTGDLEPLAGAAPQGHPALGLDLEKAIASLPAGARQAFVLHDVHGFEHAEIARLTGLAVGTCKAQVHRARRLLREALQP